MLSDGETFISADDLRINLWNLEISSQSFNIVDVKPANMEDLTGIARHLFYRNFNTLAITNSTKKFFISLVFLEFLANLT